MIRNHFYSNHLVDAKIVILMAVVHDLNLVVVVADNMIETYPYKDLIIVP